MHRGEGALRACIGAEKEIRVKGVVRSCGTKGAGAVGVRGASEKPVGGIGSTIGVGMGKGGD